jgi:hypothetical protein
MITRMQAFVCVVRPYTQSANQRRGVIVTPADVTLIPGERWVPRLERFYSRDISPPIIECETLSATSLWCWGLMSLSIVGQNYTPNDILIIYSLFCTHSSPTMQFHYRHYFQHLLATARVRPLKCLGSARSCASASSSTNLDLNWCEGAMGDCYKKFSFSHFSVARIGMNHSHGS